MLVVFSPAPPTTMGPPTPASCMVDGLDVRLIEMVLEQKKERREWILGLLLALFVQ